MKDSNYELLSNSESQLNIEKKHLSLLKISFDFIIYSLFVLSYLISLENNNFSKLLLVVTIFINLLLIKRVIKIKAVAVLFIFIITYLIFTIPYFFFDIKISAYHQFQNIDAFSDTLRVFSIFIFTIFIFLRPKLSKNNSSAISDKIKKEDSILLFIISIFVIFFIILFGTTGQTIFQNAYGSLKVSYFFNLAIFEYAYIFFIMAYKYSGKSEIRRVIIFIMAALFIIKDFLIGGRIESLQMIILLFILFWEKKINYKTLILFIIIGFYLLTAFGNIRGDIKNFDNINMSILNPFGGITNQGEVFYSSAAFIGLKNYGLLNTNKSFEYFVLSLILPSRYLPIKISDLPWYVSSFTPIGGGGGIFAYFYVWFGIYGVVGIAIFLSFLINLAYKSSNEYLILYSVMVLSTYPRWFAYSPITLFKLCLYILPVYFIYKIMFNSFRKGN